MPPSKPLAALILGESPVLAELADLEAPYPLDGASRRAPAKGKLPCRKIELVAYAGDVVRYEEGLRVHPAFVERLRRFERVVRDVAVEHYGRAPARISHLGAFGCRRIGGYPTRLSEHALGNGIDVSGFVFGALPRGEGEESKIPKALRGSFRVSVLPLEGETWSSSEPSARHG